MRPLSFVLRGNLSLPLYVYLHICRICAVVSYHRALRPRVLRRRLDKALPGLLGLHDLLSARTSALDGEAPGGGVGTVRLWRRSRGLRHESVAAFDALQVALERAVLVGGTAAAPPESAGRRSRFSLASQFLEIGTRLLPLASQRGGGGRPSAG